MPWDKGELRNPATPEPGFYSMRLVKKGPPVAACIRRTAVEHQEDSALWYALINGEHTGECDADPELCSGVQRVWLSGKRIDQAEYDFLLARYKFYAAHHPDHPFANPNKPVERRLMPPIGG